MKIPSKLIFADNKVKEAFNKLKEGKTEDKVLYGFLERAFSDICENAFCGIRMQKRLIPEEYKRKYVMDNIWKYNLPNAWRLIYSVGKHDVIVMSIVLEWMDHKNYERKFGYRKK